MNVRVVKKPDRFQLIPLSAITTREPAIATVDGHAVYRAPAGELPNVVMAYALPRIGPSGTAAGVHEELHLERHTFGLERVFTPRERRGVARSGWGWRGHRVEKGRRGAKPVALASRWEWEIFAPAGTPAKVLRQATDGMEITPTLTVWARDGWRKGADVFADPVEVVAKVIARGFVEQLNRPGMVEQLVEVPE